MVNCFSYYGLLDGGHVKLRGGLGEDGETVSLTTDCLMEDLSSSEDEDFTWEALAPEKRLQAFQARGFASE
eukprot:5679829-Amphidinium_carterae.1